MGSHQRVQLDVTTNRKLSLVSNRLGETEQPVSWSDTPLKDGYQVIQLYLAVESCPTNANHAT